MQQFSIGFPRFEGRFFSITMYIYRCENCCTWNQSYLFPRYILCKIVALLRDYIRELLENIHFHSSFSSHIAHRFITLFFLILIFQAWHNRVANIIFQQVHWVYFDFVTRVSHFVPRSNVSGTKRKLDQLYLLKDCIELRACFETHF